MLVRQTLLFAGLVALGCASKSEARPSLAGGDVAYDANGAAMKGYLAYDAGSAAKRPGVLVVPEWWGVNDYVRKRADMIAALGYTALVVDMYGDGRTAATPDEASRMSSEVMSDPALMRSRFDAALDLLRRQPNVDPGRIAAIGYCFGGGVVLTMARAGADLDAVASFHGNLSPVAPARSGAVRAELLILSGEADPMVLADKVEAFRHEMTEARATFRIVTYPGATHAFTNPDATELGRRFGIPIAYDAAADRESWEEMREFLARTLGRS